MYRTDQSYYCARAEQERECARNADCVEAADIHIRLAICYETLAQGLR